MGVLLMQLNQEAPVLRFCAARLYFECVQLLREVDDQLEQDIDEEELVRHLAKQGGKRRAFRVGEGR